MDTVEPNNILSYTIAELMEVLKIDDLEKENVVYNSNNLINQAINENNYPLAEFYEDVKNNLIEFIETFDSENENEEQSENNNDNENEPMDEYYTSEVKEGDINPLVNKTEKRFIVLDSQYLPEGVSKTNFVANLSEKIKRVINIKLHSYSIPFNWYLISSQKRNNVIYLLLNNNEKVKILIDDGNYSTTQMVAELNSKLKQKLNINTDTVTYNESTGKIKFNLPTNQVEKIIFFDKSEPYLLSNEDNIFSTLRSYKNLTLGWILGFREDEVTVQESGNISDVIPDLKGPRYLYLVVDDFKRNHTTNNLVTITNIDENISVPSYFNHHMPLNETDCNDNIVTVLPSAPRTLTQAQIYTINEVMKHKNRTNYYSNSPNESDILAVIPLKHNGLTIGDRIVETSGQLQDNKREYNGPVDLDRIGVKLMDDTGFIVDLNGSDWTLTLMYEYIYQM
jgi:hypothetical protein